MNKNIELIFVYNADAGIFSVVSDFAHKILSPNTYACNLCKLTYGAFSMNKEWKEFLDKLLYKKEFLHKDEFQKKYPQMINLLLPAVLIRSDGEMKEFLTQQEINAQSDLRGLMSIFEQKLREL